MATDAATNTAGGRAEAQLGTTVGGEASGGTGTPPPCSPWPTCRRRRSRTWTSTPSASSRTGGTRSARQARSTSVGAWTASSDADPQKANLALYTAYHATTSTSRTDVIPAAKVPPPGPGPAAGRRRGAQRPRRRGQRTLLRAAAHGHRLGGQSRAGPDAQHRHRWLPRWKAGAPVTLNAFANRMDNYMAVYMAPPWRWCRA